MVALGAIGDVVEDEVVGCISMAELVRVVAWREHVRGERWLHIDGRRVGIHRQS